MTRDFDPEMLAQEIDKLKIEVRTLKHLFDEYFPLVRAQHAGKIAGAPQRTEQEINAIARADAELAKATAESLAHLRPVQRIEPTVDNLIPVQPTPDFYKQDGFPADEIGGNGYAAR